MDQYDIQKFMLIKQDASDLRQLMLGENDINEWNKLLIFYTIYLIYQHVFASYSMMQSVLKHDDFNFSRDFRSIYLFFFFICNLKVSYIYMIKTVFKVDKRLALSHHSNLGEYFDY